MIKQNWILFRKTTQCFVASIVILLIWIGLIIYTHITGYIAVDGNVNIVSVLRNSMRCEQFIFILFLFLSYEYLSQAGRYHVEECINTTQMFGILQRVYQIAILMAINFFYFICIYISNILLCILQHIQSVAYILYVGKVLVIYFLLVNVVAILLGAILSFMNKASFSYAILILMGLLTSVRAEQLIYPGYQENLYGLSDFTQIFCVAAKWSLDNAYLFPTELHFWVKPIYFIAFFSISFLLLCFIKRGDKRYLYFTITPIICGIVCVSLWFMPCDGNFAGYIDYTEQIYADEQKLLSEQKTSVDFYVLKYEMTLDLRSVLKADVVMTLSDTSLGQYEFIFCGVYLIESITDANGNALDYQREGNHLTVMNHTGNLEVIHMVYEGSHLNRFYTGKSGSYLPGNFPYYPIAGTGDIYEVGLCVLPEQESDFKVVIRNHMNIYTNLEETANNVFEGHSNQVTLVSGTFWTEKIIDGVDYIYPYITLPSNPELNNYLYEGLQEYLNKDMGNTSVSYSIKNKKILIDPGEFFVNYMFGSDMVMIGGRYELDTYYTNYLQTGNWYYEEGIMSDEELQKWLEENGAGNLMEEDDTNGKPQDELGE